MSSEALAGLIGVVVGVLLKQWLDARTQKSRWAREDALRFAADKRIAYEAFLGLIDEMDQIMTLGGDAAGILRHHETEGSPPLNPDDFMRLRGEANNVAPQLVALLPKVNQQLRHIALLGPPDVVAYCDDLRTAVFMAHVHGASEDARNKLHALRAAFRLAARQDLRVDQPATNG